MGRLSELRNVKLFDHGAHIISRDHEIVREYCEGNKYSKTLGS